MLGVKKDYNGRERDLPLNIKKPDLLVTCYGNDLDIKDFLEKNTLPHLAKALDLMLIK